MMTDHKEPASLKEVPDPILSKEEKKKQFGEVFTPRELVNEMLDQLPADLWSDPNKTWLDNSCGEGAFLIEVKRRLMEGLCQWEPDPIRREQHILDKQLYGVELQQDNWQRCRINLGLTADGNDGNIVCADGLTYNYTFAKDPKGGYKIDDNTFEDLFDF
jgi:type I restriction-modification system DNA methylase subunit